MKIIITGGFGFLGRQLCKRILGLGAMVGSDEQNHQVSEVVLLDVADIPEDIKSMTRVTAIKGDVTDLDTCKKLVDEDGMIVFHFASIMSGQGENDFDLCWKVNMEGTRNLLEACRLRKSSKFIFTSSGACFGDRLDDGPENEFTKLLPHTTHGMTKACCELIINDYSRRGFLDGRVARLPTVIPRPEVNSGLPAAFSAVAREPIKGEDVTIPISPDMPLSVCGFRALIRNLLHLANLPQSVFSGMLDRCMNLPSINVTVQELYAALQSVVQDPSKLGQVTYKPDKALCAKLGTFPYKMDASRARAHGMLADTSAASIITDFVAEYVDETLLKPVLEISQEPRHNLVLANKHIKVFRAEFAVGDRTLMHAHRVDSLYFFMCDMKLKNEIQFKEPLEESLSYGEVRYGALGTEPLVHRITCLGPKPMFCLDIELTGLNTGDMSDPPPAKKARTEKVPSGLVLMKTTPGALVYKLYVASGGTWEAWLPFPRVLWIVEKGSVVEGDLGNRTLLTAGVLYREGPAQVKIKVVGKTDLSLWLLELLH